MRNLLPFNKKNNGEFFNGSNIPCLMQKSGSGILILILILFTPQLFSQELILSGRIYDKSNNQELSSASIISPSTLRGAISDEDGFFTLSLPYGKNELSFSYMGFELKDSTFFLSNDINIKIYLEPLSFPVEEITVKGDGRKDYVSSLEMGSFFFESKELSFVPSLLGEVDPLKVLQLTPGIQNSSDGGAGFYVRGGGVDQNLVLYDNTLLYNPGHLMGVYSVFNSDLIQDVSIIKSGIPARYGSKLSSVISLSSYKGNPDSLEVKGSLGLIFSKISVNGPLLKDKATFIIGARRTYIGLVVNPILKHSATSTSSFSNQNSYNFNDFNAGISWNISSSDNISFSGYYGRDNFKTSRPGVKQDNSLNWGNSMATINWKHKFHENAEINTNISWTKYDFGLSGLQSEINFGLISKVRDYNLKSELTLEKGKSLISTGIEITDHSFLPNKIKARIGDFEINFSNPENMNALEGGVFLSNEYTMSPKLAISGGLRLSFYNQYGPHYEFERNTFGEPSDTIKYKRKESLAFYVQPEPRLVLKYQLNNNTSVKASYMRMAQFVHLATSSSASLPLDIWIPSTSEIEPTIGNQVSLGYFKNFNERQFVFSAEMYFKKMNHSLEFLRGILMSSMEGSLENNIINGFGRSYGIEFYLAKNTGRTTGWLSYTLSRTEHKFNEINDGFFYPAKYDRRHDLSIAMTRKLSNKWRSSLVFMYISGNAFTMPISRYIIQGNVANQYGKVNSFRMPPNHRLDISFTRNITFKKKWNSECVFSIYNVYNRMNPYYIYYEVVGDVDSYTLSVETFYVSFIPIIPSVSWNFKF